MLHTTNTPPVCVSSSSKAEAYFDAHGILPKLCSWYDSPIPKGIKVYVDGFMVLATSLPKTVPFRDTRVRPLDCASLRYGPNGLYCLDKDPMMGATR